MKTLSALCLVLLCGCVSGTTPAKPPSFSQLECITTALIPYGVSDAQALAKDITDGNISAQDVIDILALGLEAESEFKAAYAACTGKPLAVKAPPPAYGDKVL